MALEVLVESLAFLVALAVLVENLAFLEARVASFLEHLEDRVVLEASSYLVEVENRCP